MTPQDLERRLNSDIKAALAYLNTVVARNAGRPLIELEALPDVQESLNTIREWLNDVMRLAQQLPASMQEDRLAVIKTVTRMHSDLDERVWAYPKATDTFLTRLVWLMAWLLWPFILLEALASKRYTQKTWISRLAPNTCRYCRGLHGVTLPLEKSFAPTARALGWTRIYGSMLVPPAHPSCGCYLIFS